MLKDFMELLGNDARFQLKKPSLRTNEKSLYLPVMHEALKVNLDKTMQSLIEDGDIIYVTDPALQNTINLNIKFAK